MRRARLRTARLKPQSCPYFEGCPLFIPGPGRDQPGPRLARQVSPSPTRARLDSRLTSRTCDTCPELSSWLQAAGIRDRGDVLGTADLSVSGTSHAIHQCGGGGREDLGVLRECSTGLAPEDLPGLPTRQCLLPPAQPPPGPSFTCCPVPGASTSLPLSLGIWGLEIVWPGKA